MATHRIGELEITTSPHLAAGDVEIYVRKALDRAGDDLERRHPGQIFCVREIPLRWRLDADELRTGADLDAVGSQIANEIEALCRPARARPPYGDAVHFQNRSEYWATYLEIRADIDNGRLWPFASLHHTAHPFEALLAAGSRTLITDALVSIAQRDLTRFFKLASSASDTVLEKLAAVLGIDRRATRSGSPRESTASPSTDDIKTLVSLLDRADRFGSAVLRSMLAFGVLSANRKAMRAEEVAVLAEAAVARADGGADAPPQAYPDREFPTQFAGAVFLLNLIREIEMDEILWTACLPEGEALRRALGPLFESEEHDDLVRLLFASPGLEWPSDSDRQRAIACPLAMRLISALNRRGFPDPPVWRISDVTHGGLDWRIVTAGDLPYPALIVAKENIADLDDLGLDLVEGGLAPELWPTQDAGGEAAICAQLRGALLTLWAAATGSRPMASDDMATSFLKIPGRCILKEDECVVRIPIEFLDIRVRSAGLDRDPKWIPWIERNVRIEYEGAEEQ